MSSSEKRRDSDTSAAGGGEKNVFSEERAVVPPKRQRTGGDDRALVPSSAVSGAASKTALIPIPAGVKRTSSLCAPTLQLTGHEGPVLSAKFDHTGSHLASGSQDRSVFVWTLEPNGEFRNSAALRGHSNTLLEVAWLPRGTELISAAADRRLAQWDATAGVCVRWYQGHRSYVNGCATAREQPFVFASVSDDRCLRLWDTRARFAERIVPLPYQQTAVAFQSQGELVCVGGIDNVIRVFDVRVLREGGPGEGEEGGGARPLLTLEGHTDTVTGLAVSPDDVYLLSNSADHSLLVWDLRPFVRGGGERCVKRFVGHQHNFEKLLLRCAWSHDGAMVTAGSSDRFVYVWDTHSCAVRYKLPGHAGSVNEVRFHPREPIIVSASSDKTLYVGELADV